MPYKTTRGPVGEEVALRDGALHVPDNSIMLFVRGDSTGPDITLQQVLMHADEFDVIATMKLSGDYVSDALAAQAR